MAVVDEPGRIEPSITRAFRSRIAAAVVLVVIATGVTVFLAHRHSTTAATAVVAPVAGTPINIGVTDCGKGWSGGHAGHFRFAVTNGAAEGVGAQIQNIATGATYLDIEGLGIGVSHAYDVTLGPGSYRWVCFPDESGVGIGTPAKVTGSYSGALTPGIVPITGADLDPLAGTYSAWIMQRLPVLQRQVRGLAGDLHRGDLEGAKRDWLGGHMTYNTLGAAYDAFGTHDAAIQGDGFGTIERLLWSGAPAARIAPHARKLVAAVASLRSDFAAKPMVEGWQIGLRAHEILEDAILTVLNGEADGGSHTELATLAANVAGTQELMRLLHPMLTGRDQHLDETDQALARLRTLLLSYRHGGRWTPLTSLTTAEREQVDAQTQQATELLSDVAMITDTRERLG